MKQTLKLIITVLLCSLLLISCAESSEPDGEAPSFDSETSTDLGGYVFEYGCSMGNDYSEVVLGYTAETLLSEVAAQRLADVQKNLNCVINVDYCIYGESSEKMKAGILSGQGGYDALQNETYVMEDYARAGFLEGFSGLSGLDCTDHDKWGTEAYLEEMYWENDLYGVIPYSWPNIPFTGVCGCFVVNETLVSALGETDPRDYVENGTWTWDKFDEVLKAYTTTDGSDTVYGMQTHAPYFIQLMACSNGNSMVEIDENTGAPKISWYDASCVEAIRKASSILYDEGKSYVSPDNTTDDYVFLERGCVMTVKGGSDIIYDIIYDTDDEIGILSTPKGPRATENIYETFHSSIIYITCIPVNCKDLDSASMILDALYEPLDGYETREDVISYMLRYTFFDSRDCDTYLKYLDNSHYDYFKEKARDVLTSAAEGKSVTEVLETYRSKMDNILSEYVVPVMSGIEAVNGTK